MDAPNGHNHGFPGNQLRKVFVLELNRNLNGMLVNMNEGQSNYAKMHSVASLGGFSELINHRLRSHYPQNVIITLDDLFYQIWQT